MRAIAPEDKELLLRGFQRLSEESRYRRFLTPMETLGPSMLAYLTEVDHHDHEALIALDPGSGEAVGVARYVREDDRVAEAAVTVADDWQGRGLGMALTAMLAERAVEEGVDRFMALLLAENKPMIEVLGAVGSVTITPAESGTLDVEVALEPDRPGAGKGLYGVLRAAARRTADLARPSWASKPDGG